MHTQALEGDIGTIADTAVCDLTLSLVRESWCILAVTKGTLVASNSVGESLACSAKVDGGCDKVDMLMQAGWKGVGLGTDDVGLAIRVYVVLGIEHLLGNSNRNTDVDPVAVGLRGSETVRSEPLLNKAVGFVIGSSVLINLLLGQLYKSKGQLLPRLLRNLTKAWTYMLTVALVIDIRHLVEVLVDVSRLLKSNREINDLLGVSSGYVVPARSDIVNGLKGLMLSSPVPRCCRYSSRTEREQGDGELHDVGAFCHSLAETGREDWEGVKSWNEGRQGEECEVQGVEGREGRLTLSSNMLRTYREHAF